MIKYALVLLLLTGCSTILPVKAKFPESPEILMEKCSNLKKVNDDDKLSDLSKVIVTNYTNYHICSTKNDAWIEWYNTQKKIFEGVK